MAQDLANAIAKTPPTSDRQPLPPSKAKSLTESDHKEAIALPQSHKSYTTESTEGRQQSEVEHQLHPAQSYKNSDPLSRKCCYIVAQVLSQHTQREVSPEQIISTCVANEILWVELNGDRVVSIAIENFRAIRRQQMEEQARVEAEMDVAGVLRESLDVPWLMPSIRRELSSEHCETSCEHSACNSEHLGFSSDRLGSSFLDNSPSSTDKSTDIPDNSPSSTDKSTDIPDWDIEIDSDEHPLTPTYRVWLSWHFLGSFHQSPIDGTWLTSPTYGHDYNRHQTSDEAITAITTAWNCAQQLRNSDKEVSL